MLPRLLFPLYGFSAFFAAAALASAANPPAKRVPPPGVPIAEEDRRELSAGVEALGKSLSAFRHDFAGKSAVLGQLADVEIYRKGVDWALRYDEIFDLKQVATAKRHLATANQRLAELRAGKPSWNDASGLVVRGYTSAIDGSVQPYGLIMPADFKPGETTPRRLDFWFHGRGDKLSELSFIETQTNTRGAFNPEGAIVCHLYGRYCNANKFAGEIDLFEALAEIKKRYRIDENRVSVRGFSMGGAACWQFATHYPGSWAAAAPGAGFAETAEFYKVFAPEKTPPPWWEQVLWRWYDSTVYAANLAGSQLIAYSGEIDGQKQAADIMTRFAKAEGLEFPHLIGPQTAHEYHPAAKPEIEKFVTAAAVKGREPVPNKVHFTTYTLIYPRRAWLEIERMGKQWERADLDAQLTANGVLAQAKNITAFRVTLPASQFPAQSKPTLKIDETVLPIVQTQGLWQAHIQRVGAKWETVGATRPAAGLTKHVGLCGPIDHAFMSSFVMVRPTGKPLHERTGTWAAQEMERAIREWRSVFRGDAPLQDDRALSAEAIKNSNLILWGDPASNAVLAKILPQLPIKWDKDFLEFAGRKYPAAEHAPILIFPNPLNPAHYVVLNSGPTFREDAAFNNSNQTPKLPDWAMINVLTPPDGHAPGEVIDAGFFDEEWRAAQR